MWWEVLHWLSTIERRSGLGLKAFGLGRRYLGLFIFISCENCYGVTVSTFWGAQLWISFGHTPSIKFDPNPQSKVQAWIFPVCLCIQYKCWNNTTNKEVQKNAKDYKQAAKTINKTLVELLLVQDQRMSFIPSICCKLLSSVDICMCVTCSCTYRMCISVRVSINGEKGRAQLC